MKSALSLFLQFFTLGCTSFGGPAAHLGYFRTVFVEQKKWLSENEYSQLIALSQFLPGPGSSQVGFAIGLKRQGLLGGVLAFIGFTLPSFLVMLAIALGVSEFTQQPFVTELIAVLKIFAVFVVLDAVLGMAKNFCQDNHTIVLAVLTTCAIWLIPHPLVQIACLFVAAIYGYLKLTINSENHTSRSQFNLWPLVIFGGVFILILSGLLPISELFQQTFIAGSLVFGGGHVVLPLLQDYFATSIGDNAFITGYAAAQAIPGPMFTFATYLGALSHPQAWLGAIIATLGIFLPGFILILALHKQWQSLAEQPKIAGSIKGVNAAVVGLLFATLYDPIFTSAIHNSSDIAIAAMGFVLLRFIKLPILWILLLAVIVSGIRTWLL
ncbi:MAG: chromate efflux transporter [Gammaproteobacteria bacterium]|nr:chromate efflux transporter [Gammaproteobacteria bacterium]